MARYRLEPHPETPGGGVVGVTVSLKGVADALHLTYCVEGGEKVIVPSAAAPARVDGLWRTTCFELFVAGEGGRYVEFNFSPSTQWAAYAFDGYRAEMAELPLEAPPVVRWEDDTLHVHLRHPGLVRGSRSPRVETAEVRREGWTPARGRGNGVRVGLSAVIEERGGVKSYWALAHAPGAPDFHNSAGFLATLPAPREG